MIKYFCQKVLENCPSFVPSEKAPNTYQDLKNCGELKIWTGESDNTIFNDPTINWAFRAFHDLGHLESGLNFTPEQEIELGRIQASKFDGAFADLIYIEVSKQAEYYLNNGVFVPDQKQFTIDLLSKNWKVA